MYDPPGYLWAITIAGITAIPAATCVVLYYGAERAGLGRRRAALLAGGAAVVLAGWFTASAVIAGHGWYHARLGHGVPWMPVAVIGFLLALLALRRIPVVARALAAPGMTNRLEAPHAFRVTGDHPAGGEPAAEHDGGAAGEQRRPRPAQAGARRPAVQDDAGSGRDRGDPGDDDRPQVARRVVHGSLP